ERSASDKWRAAPAFFRSMLAMKSQYDAIVCVDYRGIGVAAVAAGRWLGRPVIMQGETAGVLAGSLDVSSSGIAPEPLLERVLKAPVRAIYRRADHIVCIGRDLEREAIRAGVPRERVHYLPHGVDLERFHPAAAAERERIRIDVGWPIDRPVVLFVGRLSLEKGVMDLLNAWRIAQPRDAVLALVGPDMAGHPWDAGQQGRAFAAANALGDRVRIAGGKADPAPYYSAVDRHLPSSCLQARAYTEIR